MDKNDNYKVNFNLIPSSFQDEAKKTMCAICNCLSNQIAFISKCKHVYCYDCLLNIQPKKFNCPIDNTLISKHKLKIIYIKARLIYTKCINHSIGCSWIGTIDEYKDHVIQCNNE